MKSINIHYCFYIAEDRRETFDLCINAQSLELEHINSENLPKWTDLEFEQCPHCPLSSESRAKCPVAVNLAGVVDRFDNILSHHEIDLEVVTEERRITHHTTAQRAISSLLGLLFATSGCPHTNFMKPMARFHLPLASEYETIFRSAGMYLLAQYFLHMEGKDNDTKLTGLKSIYDNLHTINMMIANRIRSASSSDCSVNAVILLDMFTNLMPFTIEDNLNDIRHLFDSYLGEYDKD